MSTRPDLKIIERWVKPNSHVLDLGCGDGTLLRNLAADINVRGYGLEIDEDNIVRCIEAGVNVIQTDLDIGLAKFESNSFDCVIMVQTLQAVHYPHKLVADMLRVGKEGVITFPNFGNWRVRLQLLLHGLMPVTSDLPYSWYDTPNIHLCTISDFDNFCIENKIEIIERETVDSGYHSGPLTRLFPNIFAHFALYRFRKK